MTKLAMLIVAGLLAMGSPAQASEGKKLGEGPPQIDFNPMTVPVKGLERIEYRVFTLHLESYEWMMIPSICKSVPRIVDTVINDFRSNPPQVTRTNRLDQVGMNNRMKSNVLKFVDPKLVKRVWLQEGAGETAGGVADRLPNACK